MDEAVSAAVVSAAVDSAAVDSAAVDSAGLVPIRLDLHRDHHATKAGAGRKVAMIAAGLNLDHMVGITAGLIGAAVLRAAARRRDNSASTLARAARIMPSPRIAADRRVISANVPSDATGAAGRMPHAVINAGRTIRQADIMPAGRTAIAAERHGADLLITVRDTAGITDRTAASPIIGMVAVGETVLQCTGRTADGDRRGISAGARIMAADRTISPAFMADLPPHSIVPLAAPSRAAGATNVVATFRPGDRARAPTGGAASWRRLAGR